MIAKHHEDRWTKLVSNRNYRKQGRPAKRWEDDLNTYLQPDRTNRGTEEQQRLHERHDLAYHSGKQLEMRCFGKRFHEQQAQTTSTTHQHDYVNPTNNARPNNSYD